MMRTYTFEHFYPCYPSRGEFGRVHVGTFEENRDFLSPSMIRTREFMAANKKEAENKVRQLCGVLNIRFSR